MTVDLLDGTSGHSRYGEFIVYIISREMLNVYRLENGKSYPGHLGLIIANSIMTPIKYIIMFKSSWRNEE